jgi:cell division protein FtsX
MIVSLAMCVNYSIAIPSMMCEIIITNNWPTVEILHFAGASDAFIRRELRRFAQRHLISALIKAVIVDFILYSSINYAASFYSKNIAVELLEGGGRVLISGVFLFVAMTIVLFVKLFFRISIK